MDNELYHYGIKGMKWGVRRYQNPDGSLTEAGKKRQFKQERKQLKKDIQAARRVNQNKHQREVLQEMRNERRNDLEYQVTRLKKNLADKDYEEASNSYSDEDSLKGAISRELYRKTSKDSRAASRAYLDQKQKYYDKYIDKYTDARIKDMGFDDVSKGREVLRKYNLLNQNDNMASWRLWLDTSFDSND